MKAAKRFHLAAMITADGNEGVITDPRLVPL